MIIKLHASKLFTTDTADRFARRFGVPPLIWNEIWKRHLAGYDDEALAGYFIYKTGKKIKARTIQRWLVKTQIYCRANHVMLMGVRAVQSEFFGVYEPFVLEEVLRNMKGGLSKGSRIVL